MYARCAFLKSPPGQEPGSAPGSVLWHGVELEDLSGVIESVTPDAQVVSLLMSTNVKKDAVVLRGLVAAQNNLAEKVKIAKQHPYRLAFALTDFKLQGRTLPKLIINIFKRCTPPWMNLASFYVLISRCRTSDSLRLLQYDREGLEAVCTLKHDEYLVAWERGYDHAGKWSDALAVAALERVRRTRQQAKAAASRRREEGEGCATDGCEAEGRCSAAAGRQEGSGGRGSATDATDSTRHRGG